MNESILIIGAGGHGKVVAEIARILGYSRIDYLDDKSPEAVGKLDQMENVALTYGAVIVSIGNLPLRKEIQERLESVNAPLVSLIHPNAYVSPSALICEGTIILPGAIVHSNVKIGKGCIVSIGALIDHDAVIDDYCHINTGAVIGAGANIPPLTKVQAGEIRI